MDKAEKESSTIESLIKDIVDCELGMFVAVPNAGGPAECQQRPDTFRLMRWMTHCVHTESTLRALLADLRKAEVENQNLMTKKYAIMANQIEVATPNPLCELITTAETAFMHEASKRYPHSITMVTGGDGFWRYQFAELQTWSDASLELYASEVTEALLENRNLAVERFDRLWKRLGYASIEDREAQLTCESSAKNIT